MEAETLVPVSVPLSDVRKIKKQSSFGSNSDVDIASRGEEDTLEFRMQAETACGKKISLWHDVSLVHIDPQSKQETPYLNFVCEIPKFTRCVTNISNGRLRHKCCRGSFCSSSQNI